MSNATDSLNAVQGTLVQRGVLDVKFFFKLEADAHALSHVEQSMADVLQAYCNGSVSPRARCNDKHLAHA